MFLSGKIGLYFEHIPYNWESPRLWTIKLYEPVDTSQTICLVWWHCNGTLRTCFIMCRIYYKKWCNLESIGNCSETLVYVATKIHF